MVVFVARFECRRRVELGGAVFKPRDLGSDRGYRVAEAGISARRIGWAGRATPLQEVGGIGSGPGLGELLGS